MSDTFEHPHQYELQSALDEGDFLRAIAIAEALLTEPEVELGQLHLLLGKLRLLVVQPEAARAHFERVLAMPLEDSPESLALLNEAREQMAWLLKEDEPEAALALLKQRAEHPEMPVWAYHLGAQLLVDCLQAQAEAAEWLRQALNSPEAHREDTQDLQVQLALWTPDDAEHALLMEQLDLGALALKGQLLPLVEGSLERHPRHLRWLKAALRQLGSACPISLQVVVLRTLLEVDGACELAAQHQNPHTEEGRRCLQLYAELLTLQGKFEDALEVLHTCRTHALELSAALYIRLSLGLLTQGKTQAAQSLAQAGLEAFPYTPELHILLGQSLLAGGKLELAQRLLQDASLEVTPQQTELHQRHHDLRALHHLIHHHPWRNYTSSEPALNHLWLGQQHYLLTLQAKGPTPLMVKAYRQPPQGLAERLERLTQLAHMPFASAALPQPLADEEGQLVQSSTTFILWAYPALEGHSLSLPGTNARLSPQQALALGAQTAELSEHLRTLNVLPEPEDTWSLWDLIANGSKGFIPKTKALGLWWRAPEHFQRVAHALDVLSSRLKPQLESLQPQLCHGDFSWHNVLWASPTSERITAIVDFDGMRTDVPFADALQASLHLSFEWGRRTSEGFPLRDTTLEAAFWQGYQEAHGTMPPHASWSDWAQVVRLRHYVQLITHHRHLSPEAWQALGLGSAALSLESAQEHMSYLQQLHPAFMNRP